MFSSASKPKVLTDVQGLIPMTTLEVVYTEDIVESLKNCSPDVILTDSIVPSVFIEKVIHPKDIRSEYDLYRECLVRNLEETQDLISIFTPTYKIGNLIRRAYESLINQSYQNWEWILVDDSPDDSTIEYLDEIAKIDPRVKVYSFRDKSNGNIGESKYRAAMLCNGSILVELDHDDILTHDCLELILRAYHTHPECGFYYSDCCEYNFDTKECQDYGEPGFGLGYESHYDTEYNGIKLHAYNCAEIRARSLAHIVGVPNHVRAWRADIYHLLRGHNRSMRIADDYELLLRTFLVTKFCYIPKLLYIQNWGNNSQDSGDNRNDIQRRVYEIYEKHKSAIDKRLEELGTERPFGMMTSNEVINSDIFDLPILSEKLEL